MALSNTIIHEIKDVLQISLRNKFQNYKRFWDFLGAEGSYQNILDCFEGLELD